MGQPMEFWYFITSVPKRVVLSTLGKGLNFSLKSSSKIMQAMNVLAQKWDEYPNALTHYIEYSKKILCDL